MEQVRLGRVVSLKSFRAIVDLEDEGASLLALKSYAEQYPVLSNLGKAAGYLRPYVTLNPEDDSVEVTPAVRGSSIWLAIANCNSEQGYSGVITLNPQALGLNSVSADVIAVKTGQQLSATRPSAGKIRWRIEMPPRAFGYFELIFDNYERWLLLSVR